MSILNNIPFVGKLIDDYGEDLVVKGIEKLTGVDISKKELTDEEKQVILDNEFRIKSLDFEELKLKYEDTINSRETNVKIQDSQYASWLAKNTAYILDFIVVLSTIFLGLMLFFVVIPQENMNIANIMFGAMLSYCSTIFGWHRGSSKGSTEKQDFINQLKVNK